MCNVYGNVIVSLSSCIMVGRSSLIVLSGVSWSLFAFGTKFVFIYCYLSSMFNVSCGV
ncbi:hypothetical protein BC941DRAFT_467034 [Chlamydoabsidia padenii]|nr:hypothetical protein BC941DRAFT_467034 [Chlamydoabsidia padenii]